MRRATKTVVCSKPAPGNLAAELVAGAEVLLRDVNKGLLPLEGFNISATLDQKGSIAVIYVEPTDDYDLYS